MKERNNQERTVHYRHVSFRNSLRADRTASSLAVALLFLARLPVSAQENSGGMLSRSAQIEQERQKKAAQLEPDKPDRVERAFIKGKRVLDLILVSPPAGIRPKFSSSAPGWGSLVLGSGFSVGPEYYRPDLAKGEMVFRASVIGTTKHNYLFDSQLTFPRAAGNRMIFDLLGRYKAERSINYYGPGAKSEKGSRTNYSRESSEVNARAGWKPFVRHLQVGVTAGLLLIHIGPGIAAGIAPTQQVFGPQAAPGIGQPSDYLWGGLYADFDSTDFPNLPRKGSRVRAGYDYYKNRDLGAYSFRLLRGSIEQYVPFFNQKRILALRARMAISYASPGQGVPFYLQQTIGGPDDLRGFRVFRFTDNNSLALNAEYRWEVAPALEMALFADGGKVFRRPGELNFNHVEGAGGFGFRFKSRDSVAMRLDFGFSREGFQVWFRFSDIYRHAY
jgi:hypothetical protein